MLITNAVLADDTGVRKGAVRVTGGVITQTGEALTAREGEECINAEGLVLMPAFIDLHCHFRTPGFEYKEDIATGSAAAAAGGYTYVNCMANTKPVCSSADIADKVQRQARAVGLCEVNQAVSITQNFDGVTLTHLQTLPDWVRVISEDGHGVQNNSVMWRAMQIAAQRGLLIMSHAEDSDISPVDYRLAENIETFRNLYLAQLTGARLHMCHVSTAEAVQAVARAKQNGAAVTCEVAPHHLWFAGTGYRVNPPIRTQRDVDALIDAVRDGTVDAVATDHAPHSDLDKQNGAPGMVGLETAFAVCNTKLRLNCGLPLQTVSRLLSRGPARILGLNKGRIEAGFDADLVLADIDESYTVRAAELHSKSHNTPFDGVTLTGRIHRTFKAGVTTYSAQRA